jgi:hypothetical protein
VAFEILLKGSCLGRVAECDGYFDPTWKVLCCSPYFLLIVLFETAIKISGKACVMTVRVINADELINVMEQIDGLPGRSPGQGTKPGGW